VEPAGHILKATHVGNTTETRGTDTGSVSLGPLSGFTIGVTADRGADEQIRLLVDLGADCIHGPATGSAPDDVSAAERLVRATVDGRVDAVTFTARPAVERFFDVAKTARSYDRVIQAFGTDVVPVCVDPVCAMSFSAVGLPDPLVPDRRRVEAMVQLVERHFAERTNLVDLAGISVRVQGRLAVVDGGSEAWLTDRERSILDALIERPGVVLSKRELLRRVWHGFESDEHVVEVTVARLRRRLGPASAGIETVVRRGYRTRAS
jgi:uroporphyrinogen-III synthase